MSREGVRKGFDGGRGGLVDLYIWRVLNIVCDEMRKKKKKKVGHTIIAVVTDFEGCVACAHVCDVLIGQGGWDGVVVGLG